jgi:hypothetical protein
MTKSARPRSRRRSSASAVLLLPVLALGCIKPSAPWRFPLPLPAAAQARGIGRPVAFYWNGWAAQAAQKDRPVTMVRPKASIYVSLDLATIDYASSGESAISQKLAQELATSLVPWAKAPPDEKKRFDVIVLPDQRYFDAAPQFATLDISPGRLAAALAAHRPRPKDAWSALAKGESWFRFGTFRSPQPIRVGSESGLGRIYLSIWDPDTGKPIEELVLQLCIADEGGACQNEPPVTVRYDGIAGDLQGGGSPHPAEAALQFLVRGNEVLGIYRQRGWPLKHSLVWQLQINAQDLETYLDRTLPGQLNPPLPDRIRSAGRNLYELLFPRGRADAARAALGKLVATSSEKPRLFVRLLRNSESPPLTIPVGILSLPDQGPALLGQRVRLELPLQRQIAGEGPCVSAWEQVMPAGSDPVLGGPDPTIEAALRAVDPSLLDRFRRRFGTVDIAGLQRWLETSERSPAQGLLVLSHQADGELYFSRTGPRLSLATIERQFDSPALAVLVACQTGGQDAARIVRNLNEKGVSGVIATSASIGPELAGSFLGCFWQSLELRAGQEPKVAAGRAFEDAVRCTGAHPGGAPGEDAFNPSALLFTYLGDPDAPLCRVRTDRPLALNHGAQQ